MWRTSRTNDRCSWITAASSTNRNPSCRRIRAQWSWSSGTRSPSISPRTNGTNSGCSRVRGTKPAPSHENSGSSVRTPSRTIDPREVDPVSGLEGGVFGAVETVDQRIPEGPSGDRLVEVQRARPSECDVLPVAEMSRSRGQQVLVALEHRQQLPDREIGVAEVGPVEAPFAAFELGEPVGAERTPGAEQPEGAGELEGSGHGCAAGCAGRGSSRWSRRVRPW